MKYYAIHFNRPDFVEIQFQLSKKYNYDLVIVNNGGNKAIREISERLGVEYIETTNVGINPSTSHGAAINQIIKSIDMSKDWGLIDHDMFINFYIDFNNYDVDILTIRCDNVPSKPYLWPGMLICKGGVNLSDVDFRPGIGISADTGSDTWRYVDKYKIGWCSQEIYGSKDNRMIQNSRAIVKHLYNDDLLGYHYVNGSNWAGGNVMDDKNQILKSVLF